MVLSTTEFVLPPETADEEELITRYIRPRSIQQSRAYAYFPDFGPSVSAIIRSLQLDNGNLEDTAAGWQMPVDAVRAAIAFYRRHHEFIDARILLEDDDWASDFFGPDGRPLS